MLRLIVAKIRSWSRWFRRRRARDELAALGFRVAIFPGAMARVVGIRVSRLFTLVFCLGALAAALDHEEWPEVLGSIAGDDTLLMITRSVAERKKLEARITVLMPGRH